jgi:hypothetical protein
LNGQLVSGFEELLDLYDEDTIRQYAQDRTSDSRLVNISINKPLNGMFQLFINASQTNYSSTPASGGVDSMPGTGNEYSYDFQLIGSSLVMENDTNLFGVRYSDGNTSRRTALTYDGRFPITTNFRVSPRLQAEKRKNLRDDADQWVWRSSLRLDYRYAKKHRFELELGAEWSDQELPGSLKETSQGLFGVIGYRFEF